ncbi:hypothetical protein FYJ34_02795 [Clostridiaceae bacterium 68-1-5]|uniref:Transglutaminase-like domain-containing protein n=1 Tax=Suipraeoptans intestinalis TaxID=2606628 RepID=A0A6N7URB2_9FIRM|nr:transglutaminase domain-containing protein [Suipraeoptans intestinalis]MSR93223.1 hypothetical protein [Suipraeoptans intestinalis]
MRKYNSKFLVTILILCIVLIGCTGQSQKSGMTIEDLRKKYSDSIGYDLSEKIYTVNQTESINIKVNNNVIFEEYFESAHTPTPFIVYTDDKLESPLFVPFFESGEGGTIDIDPKEIIGESFLFQNKEYALSGSGTWGMYETLYLARYNDLKTGKKLDRPVVYIIDVKHGKEKLEAPVVTKRVTDDGNLRLDWKPVKGATGYWVIKQEKRLADSANGEFNLASRYHYSFIGTGTETNFISDKQSREFLNQKNYSADDLLDPQKASDVFVVEQINKAPVDYDIFVIAQNDRDKLSPPSNMIHASEFTGAMPYRIAFNTFMKDTDNRGFVLRDLKDIPTTVPVIMMDGSIRNFAIQYDLENDKFFFSENRNQNIYDLPIAIKNTPFTDTIKVYGASEDYEGIVEAKSKEVEGLSKTGVSTLVVDAEYKAKLKLDKSSVVNTVATVDYDYVAYSPLEEYIVTNMLAGNFNLDMAAFPEVKNKVVLSEAFRNVLENNPIIATIPGYYYSDSEKLLQISVSKTEFKKQKDLAEKVDQIIKSVIKEGMSDEEKSKAINDYLTEHTEYDYDALTALKNHEAVEQNPASTGAQISQAENDFMKYDESFKAMGVLMKGKGVCAGYADAYRILTGYAGLEVLTVRGDVPGGRHAWNLVYLDGKWLVVDVTWNDSDHNPNKYLHISQEDPTYVGDHFISADSISARDNYVFKK